MKRTTRTGSALLLLTSLSMPIQAGTHAASVPAEEKTAGFEGIWSEDKSCSPYHRQMKYTQEYMDDGAAFTCAYPGRVQALGDSHWQMEADCIRHFYPFETGDEQDVQDDGDYLFRSVPFHIELEKTGAAPDDIRLLQRFQHNGKTLQSRELYPCEQSDEDWEFRRTHPLLPAFHTHIKLSALPAEKHQGFEGSWCMEDEDISHAEWAYDHVDYYSNHLFEPLRHVCRYQGEVKTLGDNHWQLLVNCHDTFDAGEERDDENTVDHYLLELKKSGDRLSERFTTLQGKESQSRELHRCAVVDNPASEEATPTARTPENPASVTTWPFEGFWGEDKDCTEENARVEYGADYNRFSLMGCSWDDEYGKMEQIAPNHWKIEATCLLPFWWEDEDGESFRGNRDVDSLIELTIENDRLIETRSFQHEDYDPEPSVEHFYRCNNPPPSPVPNPGENRQGLSAPGLFPFIHSEPIKQT